MFKLRCLLHCGAEEGRIGNPERNLQNLLVTVNPIGVNNHCKCRKTYILITFSLVEAFPCISTGDNNYPREAACEVALKAVREFLEEKKHVNNFFI